jgi:hypothetical protein
MAPTTFRFVRIFHLLVFTFGLITNGDSGSEIFGACCSGAESVDARSGGAFVAILAAVIDDFSDFGLGLL